MLHGAMEDRRASFNGGSDGRRLLPLIDVFMPVTSIVYPILSTHASACFSFPLIVLHVEVSVVCILWRLLI